MRTRSPSSVALLALLGWALGTSHGRSQASWRWLASILVAGSVAALQACKRLLLGDRLSRWEPTRRDFAATHAYAR